MLLDEKILTFSEAAEQLPRLNGKKIHPSSLWRWARKGVRGVKLETRRVGGRFVTSAEALERFTRELAELPLETRSVPRRSKRPKKRSSKQREKDLRRAEQELSDAGIR